MVSGLGGWWQLAPPGQLLYRAAYLSGAEFDEVSPPTPPLRESRVGFSLKGSRLGSESQQCLCLGAPKPTEPFLRACCLPRTIGFLGGSAAACVYWGVWWGLSLGYQTSL